LITDTWLKGAKGKPLEKVEETADRDGLSVRISRKAKVVFQMRFSFDGKPCRLDLGAYPRMCLKAARDENERLRGLLENEGRDRPGAVATLAAALAREGFEPFYADDKKGYLRHVATNTIATPRANPHRPFSASEMARREQLITYFNRPRKMN